MPAARTRARACAATLAGAVLLVACGGPPAPSPAPPPAAAPLPPATAAMLAGWNLTLPVPGAKGDAEVVAPAAAAPPWLTADDAGDLVFWAPVNGVTTKDSEHARTELDRTENFTAGAGPQTLTASLTVTQVPSAVPEVIVGQIHGAGDISSVPFVMMFYAGGTVRAVVKQEQSGEAHTDVPLLTDVPLGTPFDYTIRDNGDGSLTVSAAAGGRTMSGDAPVPSAFSGSTVRFQAGAYQQAPSAGGTAGPDDGARVAFSALEVGTQAAPPTR